MMLMDFHKQISCQTTSKRKTRYQSLYCSLNLQIHCPRSESHKFCPLAKFTRQILCNGKHDRLELPTMSPCLLTHETLFHTEFECTLKESEIGYHFVKLGISSEDPQDLITTRIDLIKNMRIKAQVRQVWNWGCNPSLFLLSFVLMILLLLLVFLYGFAFFSGLRKMAGKYFPTPSCCIGMLHQDLY